MSGSLRQIYLFIVLFLSFVYWENCCGISIMSSQFVKFLKKRTRRITLPSCIYPNKMHLLFINNFIGHIYDFGQPIFILCPIMRPYHMQIWSVATLSARPVKTNSATTTKKDFPWLFKFFFPHCLPFLGLPFGSWLCRTQPSPPLDALRKGQREPTSKQFETSELRAVPRVLRCLVGAHTPLFTPTSGRNRTTSRKAAISANDVLAPLG